MEHERDLGAARLQAWKVVVAKGAKYQHSRKSGNRETITIICAINAAGKFLPPHVMRSRRCLTPACLTSTTNITEDDIKEFCDFYHVDKSVTISELTEFWAIYKQLQTHDTVDTLIKLMSVSSHDDVNKTAVAENELTSARESSDN